MTQQPIGLSEEECIDRLQAYWDEIEQIIVLFDKDSGSILKGQKEKAQELLTNLKEKLKNDYKSRDTKKGEEQMTDVERACFAPAIHEAYANMSIKTNSIPSPTWLDELFDAQSTIQHYLSQLREKK